MTKSKLTRSPLRSAPTPTEDGPPTTDLDIALRPVLDAAFAAASSPETLRVAIGLLRQLMTFFDNVLATVGTGQTSGLVGDNPAVVHGDGRVKKGLSAREIQIVQHYAAGHSVVTIAKDFAISPHTVRNHLKTIFRKTGVHTSVELVTFAIANGLVKP